MKASKRRAIGLLTAGAILLLVFVLPASLSTAGKGAVRDAVALPQRGVAAIWLRLREAGAALRGIGGTAERNRELAYESVRLRSELNRLREVDAENRRLRRTLDFRRHHPNELTACEVIARDVSGWWHVVRIDKGSVDGIRSNRAVLSPEGLVGRTAEVARHSAEVLLVCDPACRISAKIERIGVYGLVCGGGADAKGRPLARMEFVAKDAAVRVGDEVTTSGLSGTGGFPKGVRVGAVTKVERSDNGLFLRAEIAPCAVVAPLDYVFVVVGEGAGP